MFAIFGLGNPGKEYENTRHNIGFLVADELAKRMGVSFKKKTVWQAEAAEGEMDGKRIRVVKPLTFMNLSGETVRAATSKDNIPPQNILVIFDDADIPRLAKFGFDHPDLQEDTMG
jgi:PTH1 family peptidyl-tRNA hydrolase